MRFSDDTVLDANAVVSSMRRYASSENSAFTDQAKLITSYETPDPLTVVFHLSRPWSQFPALLSNTGGMIVSPTAAQARGEQFDEQPVGAGPFKVERFVPGERLDLVRNETYWAGPVHLDGVTFTTVATASATLDRLESGEVDMVHIVGAEEIGRSIDAGHPGWIVVSNGQGHMFNVGHGNTVAPTSDVRVRQAVAAALDLDQLNQRVSEGRGLYGSTVFGPWSRLHTTGTGTTHDLQRARSLVEAVKAEKGWDGTLRLLTTNQADPTAALTVQAQLNRVGFKVQVNRVPTENDLIRRVIVDHDFDLAYWGFAAWEYAPWATLSDNLYSESRSNYAGYENPEMDQLLDELSVAATPQATKQVMGEVQRLLTEEVPLVVDRGRPSGIFWGEHVHGAVPTAEGTILLDQAFLTR